MHLYIQVERSLYCIYRRRIRIHVSIYIYTVDLQLETITQILLCKRQPDVTSTPVFTVFYFTFVNRFFNRAPRLTFAQQYLRNGFQLQINSIDVDRYMYSNSTTVNVLI
jgi:hypothetical protein